MQRHQDSAENSAPEIDGNRDRGEQDGDTGRLLQVDRNNENAMEAQRTKQSGANDCQAYPEPDPERPGNRLARFHMVLLGRSLGNVPGHRPAQPQVKQAHVGHQRANEDPDAVSQISQMVHHEGRQEKAHHRGHGQRKPIGEHVLGDAANAGHKN